MSTPHEPGTSGPYHQPPRPEDEPAAKRRREAEEAAAVPAGLPRPGTADDADDVPGQTPRPTRAPARCGRRSSSPNAHPGSNTIDFGIGTGAQTISLLSALPSITVPVLIDGTTQPGYTSAPLIDLDGTSAGSGADGLDLAAGSGGSTIRGLVINNFSGDGISITHDRQHRRRAPISGPTPRARPPAATRRCRYGIARVRPPNNTIGGELHPRQGRQPDLGKPPTASDHRSDGQLGRGQPRSAPTPPATPRSPTATTA